MQDLSKGIFLKAMRCPTLGWRLRHEEANPPAPSAGENFFRQQGREVQARSRALYPEGVTIREDDPLCAIEHTRAALQDPQAMAIHGGTFSAGGLMAQADTLVRRSAGWHLFEAKSGALLKAAYIDAMAYTTCVMELAGVSPVGISLVLVDRDYHLGMPPERLFRQIELNAAVRQRAHEFIKSAPKVELVTASAAMPAPRLSPACRGCELFGTCLGRGIENPIFDLPQLSIKHLADLTRQGIAAIEDIPPDFPLSRRQKRVRACVLSQGVYVGRRLKRQLDAITWPAFYLDFETINTAIPLYADLAPFEEVPAQYSLHVCPEPGLVSAHYEGLIDALPASRRALAEGLLNRLGDRGSIVVYSSFERRMLQILAGRYPDLAPALEALGGRLVDLEALIRHEFYHPGLHGRTSLKVALPVLVPGLTYDGLAIAEGASALCAIIDLVRGRYTEEEAQRVQRDLRDYCARDTLALVALHAALLGYTGQGHGGRRSSASP